MAGIDKLYLTYPDYLEFKKWCAEQPPLKDKYGRDSKLSDWIYDREEYTGVAPVSSLPIYLDAYVIRNCPIEAVQKEEKASYDYAYNKTLKACEGMYDQIKAGLLYASPVRENVTCGKHFSCIKHPNRKYEKPFRGKWRVEVLEPEDMWYHTAIDTWDYYDEFVNCDGWCSNMARVSSIQALKRKLLKWKLPIGARVRVTGYLRIENYEFIIKK